LINGSMKEAHDHIVRFPNLEPEDFDQIAEYAYRGNYTAPKAPQFPDSELNASSLGAFALADAMGNSGLPSSDDSPDTTAAACSTIWTADNHTTEAENAGSIYNNDDMKGAPARTELYFAEYPYRVTCSSIHLDEQHMGAPNRSWKENWGPVFRNHARVYAFGEQYLVEELKYLALVKLHAALRDHTLFRSGLNTIIELAEFVYDGNVSPDRNVKGVVDPIRQLVVGYIVVNFEHFKNYEGHRRLVEMGGEYATDVMDQMDSWFYPKYDVRSPPKQSEWGGW
ncbi:hypothetical protein CC80DRAFT_408217, partial [Byssothecium circinans]